MTKHRERREAGEHRPPDAVPVTAEGEPDLEAMSKEQLLDRARELGVSPANNAMTKEELRAAIDAAG